MCGLAGYCGINSDENMRLALVAGLAKGIDARGGDAAGYVSISPSGLRYSKRLGKFETAKLRFLQGAAKGNICLMHARFATCGKGGVEEAHPYAIRRNGRVVMWGAHNGMVPGAYASAKANGREVAVDSQEIFELLADQNYEGIQQLTGYGVITWIDALKPDHVNMARLSKDSEFHIMHLDEGGIAWASTEKILRSALEVSGFHSNMYYDLSEVGRVYSIGPEKIQKTDITGVKVAERTWSSGYFRSWGNYNSYFRDSDPTEWSGCSNKNTETSAMSEDEMEAFWNKAFAEAEAEESKSEAKNDSIVNSNTDNLPYEVWTVDGVAASFSTAERAEEFKNDLISKGKAAEVYSWDESVF